MDVEERIKDLELESLHISLRVRDLEVRLEQVVKHLKDLSDANVEFSAIVTRALGLLADKTVDWRK